ncbi:EamA family transporter RarD [Comamonas sp. 17RB]|uniref:EamA family transporter RarD n=1 Tax=Comamonas sp. 17RB TaxID=3047025 RepID=UPI0024B6F367|nr:EamA family transporter RarD [Comamonas sp. 17RB]MDI9855928.1 EamA family transporter RarD [Comamonas sp. 17RB]
MVKGVLASVLASVMFGLLYAMAPWLAPLDGEQIFGWRVVVTLPFTTALLWLLQEQGQLQAMAARVRAQPSLVLGLLASAALLGVQLWLFMWAPLHGKALPVSLGYFLLPLTLVLAGRLLFHERLTRPQLLAAVLASLGVAWELWRAGGLTLETAIVCLGYPIYFALRRKLGTDHLGGHWLDMALLVPAALWFMARAPSGLLVWQSASHLQAMLPLLGVVSAAGLALYMLASRWLPMGLFGLLSYVEPVLLALVALLLGEQLAPGQQPLYIAIFAAVAVLVVEAVVQLRQERRRKAV